MPQLITPPENRFFDSGTGDWIGDMIWDGLYPPGFAVLPFVYGPGTRSMTLLYPHVSPIKGVVNYLWVYTEFSPNDANRYIEWVLTDGIYSFSGNHIYTPDHYIYLIDEQYDLPSDWEKLTSSLIFTVETDYPSFAQCYIDNVSLVGEAVPPGRPQYLPIMGIG